MSSVREKKSGSRPPSRVAGFFRWLNLLAVLLLCALAPSPSHAAGGELAVRWNACTADGAVDIVQTCTSNVLERHINFSFVPFDSVTQVVGWSVVFDLASDADTLPPWWQTQPGGCRAGQFVAVAPTGFEGDCADLYSAAGSGLVQSVIYPRDGSVRKLRVVLGVSVPPADAFTLEPGLPYLAGVLGLRFANTTSGNCPGCSAPVCMVFNSLEIVRLPGAPGGDPAAFVTPSPTYGNSISSGGGTACNLVPAVNRTWGSIKALYR